MIINASASLSEAQQSEKILEAKHIWKQFHQKFQSITGNHGATRKRFYNGAKTDLSTLSPEELQKFDKAAKTLGRFWKQVRNSLSFIAFNANGNHPDEFHTFLNNQSVKKRLSHDHDQGLLSAIENGDWNAQMFKDPNTHFSAMNLFAANKITWLQKATISDVLSFQQDCGRFEAYPILTKDNEFTEGAEDFMFPYLLNHRSKKSLTDEEVEKFKYLIMTLPPSERYFFIYPEQKLDKTGSSPSKHNSLRENLSAFNYRFMNNGGRTSGRNYLYNKFYLLRNSPNQTYDEILQTITSETHPGNFYYHGMLRLSYGAENALGLATIGLKDWFSLVPRLGEQTINDVDLAGKNQARPTFSGESFHLGLLPSKVDIHGGLAPHIDAVVHDEVHRRCCSVIGYDVYHAVENIIELVRETFGLKWSKDIWLLRDFIFESVELEFQDKDFPRLPYLDKHTDERTLYTTVLLFECLAHTYDEADLENCPKIIEEKMREKHLGFDTNGFPSHWAICFVIDLVRNPEKWKVYFVSNNILHHSYNSTFQGIIHLAEQLNQKGLFSNNMKTNILKLDRLHRQIGKNISITGDYSTQIQKLTREFGKIDAQADEYQVVRDNKQVYLGFMKKSAKLPEVPTRFGTRERKSVARYQPPEKKQKQDKPPSSDFDILNYISEAELDSIASNQTKYKN